MWRMLKESRSEFCDGSCKKRGKQQQDNSRLIQDIKRLHHERDGLFDSPRIYEEQSYDGESRSLNRDFTASKDNMKWVTDITYILAGEG